MKVRIKKRYLTLAFAIICTIAFVALTAFNDYMWADRTIKAKMKHQWAVVAVGEPQASPLHPWTYATKPISKLAFIKINEIENIGNDLVVVKMLCVNHEHLTRTKKKLLQKVIDCKSDKIAVIDVETSIKKINLSKLDWRDAQVAAMDKQIIEAVCEE